MFHTCKSEVVVITDNVSVFDTTLCSPRRDAAETDVRVSRWRQDKRQWHHEENHYPSCLRRVQAEKDVSDGLRAASYMARNQADP